MKILRVVICLVVALGVVLSTYVVSQAYSDALGERIIHTFMVEKGIAIERNTEAYMYFMRSILLGEHLELTGEDSEYVNSQKELDLVIEYATEQMSPLFEGLPKEPELPEVLPKLDSSDNSGKAGGKLLRTFLAYDRADAIDYAYDWWDSQNSSYPDFGGQDCTNFVSQAMVAGGFSMAGSGDGCRDESTSTEWYVESNSPPLWCWGSNRNWEWSTSWSVVWPFRDYFTIQNSYATTLGWTTSASTAKSYLSPGDIVQLQYLDGSNWVSYHNMLVTDEDSSDLLLTYHSTDTEDKPLSDISAGPTQRYLLIRFP